MGVKKICIAFNAGRTPVYFWRMIYSDHVRQSTLRARAKPLNHSTVKSSRVTERMRTAVNKAHYSQQPMD